MKTTHISTANITIRIDGDRKAKAFTIADKKPAAAREKGLLTVVGSRGGIKSLVRNVNSGKWALCDERRTSYVVEIDGVEV